MGMTPEQVNQEMQAAQGRPPTEEEMANWTEYGQAGQLQLELTGSSSYETEDGTVVQDGAYITIETFADGGVRKTFKQPMGEDFDPLKYIKDNEMGYVNWELPDGAMKNADNGMNALGLQDNGMYAYTNSTVKTGVLGSGFENLINQMPDSVKSIVEYATPVGFADVVTGGSILGSEFHGDAAGELNKIGGNRAAFYTELGMKTAAVAGAAATGQWWAVPAMTAGVATAQSLSGKPQDWTDVAVQSAIGILPGPAAALAQAGYQKSRGASWQDVGTGLAIDYVAGAAGYKYGGFARVATTVAAGYALNGSEYDPIVDLIRSAPGMTEKPVAGGTFMGYNRSLASGLSAAVDPNYYKAQFGMKVPQQTGFVLAGPPQATPAPAYSSGVIDPMLDPVLSIALTSGRGSRSETLAPFQRIRQPGDTMPAPAPVVLAGPEDEPYITNTLPREPVLAPLAPVDDAGYINTEAWRILASKPGATEADLELAEQMSAEWRSGFPNGDYGL